jgi:uncharacterized repeat protein (TIGR03847 family)
MTEPIDLPAPDHFTAGTIGPPGQRVFFLQAHDHGALVSLKCEKQQVGALADYMAGLLADLPEPEGAQVGEVGLVDPVEPLWTVGSLAVAWDNDADRFLLVVEEFVPEADDETAEAEAESSPLDPADPVDPLDPLDQLDPGRSSVRLRLTREQVASFILTARGLLAAGRPPCPICGFPVDPGGHACPRSNGQRRPSR